MSAYSFHMDPIRRHHGGNAVERSAYQSRERLVCLVTGREFDHTDKTDLVRSGMVGTNLPRELFWIRAELAERRFKAVVARSIKVALPHELDDDENWKLLLQLACHLAETLDTAVDVAYHKGKSPDEVANKHGHLLIPSREWDEDTGEFGAKTRILDEPWKGGGDVIDGFRKTWEVMTNKALPYWAPKVSCESHATHGKGRIPKKHLGRVATEMERRGVATTRGLYNHAVDEYHAAMEALQAIEKEMERFGLEPAIETGTFEHPELPPVPAGTMEEMADQTVQAGPSAPIPEPEFALAPASLEEDLETALASVSAAGPGTHQVDLSTSPGLSPPIHPEEDIPPPELMPRTLDVELDEVMANVSNPSAAQAPPPFLAG